MHRLMTRLLLPLIALFGAASPAQAWWDYGHATIARIALMEVRPSTRAAILRLMQQSRAIDTPTCPTQTIEDVATWADCIKSLGDRFSYAASWHYQNINVCQEFDIRRNCPGGNCVSAQIERDWRLLKTPGVPLRERLQALFFLIHFVGDLHMPLHAGDHADLGGNRVRSGYGPVSNNLHSIWDGLLAERAISTPPGEAAGLLSTVTPADRAAMAAGTVDDWSRESWQVARDHVYPTVLPNVCDSSAGEQVPGRLSQEQITTLIPVVRQQVVRAGLRLAHMLDTAFDGTPLPPRPSRGGTQG